MSEVYVTVRGGFRLDYEGYTYLKDNYSNERLVTYWKCVSYNKGCKGRLKRTNEGIAAVTVPHNHEPGSTPVVSKYVSTDSEVKPNFTITPLATGGLRLEDSVGYLYRGDMDNKNGNIYWKCETTRGCPGRYKCQGNIGRITTPHFFCVPSVTFDQAVAGRNVKPEPGFNMTSATATTSSSFLVSSRAQPNPSNKDFPQRQQLSWQVEFNLPTNERATKKNPQTGEVLKRRSSLPTSELPSKRKKKDFAVSSATSKPQPDESANEILRFGKQITDRIGEINNPLLRKKLMAKILRLSFCDMDEKDWKRGYDCK